MVEGWGPEVGEVGGVGLGGWPLRRVGAEGAIATREEVVGQDMY